LPDNPNNPGFCTPVNTYADAFEVNITASLSIPTSTQYACQVLTIDTSLFGPGANLTNSRIVKFTPIIDQAQYIQHIILQECVMNMAISNDTCPTPNGICDRITYAWGPTESEFCLPHFVGMPLSSSKYYMLKILYKNSAATTGLVDHSGMRLTITTNSSVQVDAGVLMTGRIESRQLILPPGLSNVTASGVCPAICTEKIISPDTGVNVFGSFLFMHDLGHRIWTELTNNVSTEIVAEDLHFVTYNYTFEPNAPFDKIKPGDKVLTTCEYDTSGVSAESEGEVCFSFLMHYPRLPSNACGSFSADRYRDNRETAFCGTAMLWDVTLNAPIPLTCSAPASYTAHMANAIDVILPKCRVNGVDQCTDECRTLVRDWLASPCVEQWGIRFMFDFTCSNSTCDEFQALLNHNCYGLCAYNLESEHCLVPAGTISSYTCLNHECVPTYLPVTPSAEVPVVPPTDTAPAASTPTNSVRFNQRYGPAYYAMMSVVVAVGVAVAGFAVGFFVWKTVQNRELNYNANIHPN
jgi:hypothetical protein